MRFEFNNIIVNEKLFSLTKDGIKQEIEPRVFNLLVYFCRHPNVPISREDLIEHVWEKRIVSNAAINRAVSELRKIIEVQPTKPEIITTVSKVGYQFSILPVITDTLTKTVEQHESSVVVPANGLEEVNSLDWRSKNWVHSLANLRENKRSMAFFLSVCFFMAALLIALGVSYVFLPQLQKKPVFSMPEIYIEQPITALKGSSFKAQFSKDGENIVFLRKLSATGNVQVWLTNKNETSPITNDDYYYTSVIFAGDEALIASRFNNLHDRQCEIVRINLLTHQVIPVVECAKRALTYLAYSEQRNTLYFNYRSAPNSPYSIYSYQLATRRMKQITLPNSGSNLRGDYMLALSPNEEYLAVFEYQSNSASLLKFVNLTNNHVEKHQHAFNGFTAMSWLSNEYIVMADGEGIKRYHMLSKLLDVVMMNRDIGHISANAYTGKIAFDKGEVTLNIHQYQIGNVKDKSRQPQAITYSSLANYLPMYANNSSKMAYISTDKGQVAVMVRTFDDLDIDTEFSSTIKSVGNYHWSPDDRYLAASINNQLYLYDDELKYWRAPIPDSQGVHYVHFFNDQELLFSSDANGDWQIWKLNLSTGEKAPITVAGGYSVQVSEDNNVVYLTKFNQAGLYRMELLSGNEQLILPDVQITQWHKWQLRGNNIYLMTKNGLEVYELTQKTKQIVIPYQQNMLSFTVSNDQKNVLLGITESSNANIWQINTKLQQENSTL